VAYYVGQDLRDSISGLDYSQFLELYMSQGPLNPSTTRGSQPGLMQEFNKRMVNAYNIQGSVLVRTFSVFSWVFSLVHTLVLNAGNFILICDVGMEFLNGVIT
jgi:hypothetical protein